MSNLEVICRLCDLLDRAQQIIRQQAELLSMHGVETDGKALNGNGLAAWSQCQVCRRDNLWIEH